MSGASVDGITCRSEAKAKVAYHIHIDVAIYVNGQRERLPAGAGIAAPRKDEHLADGLFVENSASSCLYWPHVHAYDDIIHVEAHTSTLSRSDSSSKSGNNPSVLTSDPSRI